MKGEEIFPLLEQQCTTKSHKNCAMFRTYEKLNEINQLDLKEPLSIKISNTLLSKIVNLHTKPNFI